MLYTGDELLWIAICDDERKSVREIHDILLEGEIEPGDFKISMFDSGKEMLNASVSRYNLVIMDIMFPNENGRDIAKEYRKKNKNGMLVFCTDKSNPKAEDFNVQPYRYIRKDKIRLLRTYLLETVEEMYRRTAKKNIQFTQGKRTVLIEADKILYIEIAKTGSTVYYFDKTETVQHILVRERVKELYPKLVIYGFEFSHNSYLVNCHYLKQWNRNELELIDGTCLSISRSREKKFRKVCIRHIR